MKHPKIGMLQVMKLCSQFTHMSEEERLALQDARLRKMVAWARENSPYYVQLYRGLKDDFRQSDLPPVNKVALMSHWDEWITDRDITLEEVNEFMRNLDNVGRKFKGKYLVFTTSGSTGNPLVALCDTTTNNVMGALNAARSFAKKESMKHFIQRGGKTIGVFATGGFYLGNSSVRSRLLSMPWKKRQMALPVHFYQ